jgi:hypothetical protein
MQIEIFINETLKMVKKNDNELILGKTELLIHESLKTVWPKNVNEHLYDKIEINM